MPRIDPGKAPERKGSSYPEQFAQQMQERVRQRLGDAGGLTQFGVNLLHLPPGAWSAQRHWHSHEDEFVYVLSGEVVLVTDEGEQVLRAGDCAAFPANVPNGHHLVNRSSTVATVLEVGSRNPQQDRAQYPDIDMVYDGGTNRYLHKDGTPY